MRGSDGSTGGGRMSPRRRSCARGGRCSSRRCATTRSTASSRRAATRQARARGGRGGRGLLARDPAGLHRRPQLVNLNNGGVSPVAARRAGGDEALPRLLERGARLHDVAAARAAGRVGAPRASRASFGCDPEEIAITRNASESLRDRASSASTSKPGDEVLTTNQDYPRMLTTWRQRERRDGHRAEDDPVPGAAAEPGRPRASASSARSRRARSSSWSATSPTSPGRSSR